MIKEKILDKLSKIKRMAEGAKQIGSEAEAQSFADLLQKLLLTHKIEMTDLEFEKMEQEQPIEKHFIDYSKYPGMKVRNTRVAWIERLASIVAQAHFCRILVYPRSSYVSLVGRKEDIAVAEYMFVTLQRALEKISKTATYQHLLECKRNHTFVGHGFRDTFTQAFLMRLEERFADLRRSATTESTALVRINKSEKAVAAFMEEHFKKKAGALAVSRTYHREAAMRGRDAANRVNLSANVVEKTATTKKELV